MRSPRRPSETSAFLLAEESVQLLQQAGLPAGALYLIGTLPFLLGLIFFWSAMTHSAYAHAYASTGAFLLALLFIWMKTFQARFAQHLRSALLDSALPDWTAGAFIRTMCRQAAIHATVIIVYPVGFLTLIPMAYSAAWYQSVSVLDDGGEKSLRTLAKEAAAQAALWPRQNHVLLWLASPLMVVMGTAIFLLTFPVMNGLEEGIGEPSLLLAFGTIYAVLVLLAMLPLAPVATTLAAGIGSVVFFGIEFFHMLSGADTLYSRNPGVLLTNSTFLALICALTYAALDPVLKAAYAIRCHEGVSLRTGADLRVALQRLRSHAARATSTLLLLAVAGAVIQSSPVMAQAQDSPQAARLDQALDKELTHSRYTWRMPREPRPEAQMPWLLQALSDLATQVREWLGSAVQWARDMWNRFEDWLRGDNPRPGGAGWFTGSSPSLRMLIVVLGGVLIAITIYLLWRALRQYRPVLLETMGRLEAGAPDLADEATTAAELPEDEWYKLARQLADAGDFRLASRALFFSILATLAQGEIIRIARFKSNMDYQHELMRRASSIGEAPSLFSRSAFLYESVWYGEHEANAALLNQMHACQERLRHAIQ